MPRKKRSTPKKACPKNRKRKHRESRNTLREMRRSMQQNFLRDESLARRIVRDANIGAGDTVVEFGAGAGMLTRLLSRRAGRVLAVEYDPHWAGHLEKRFAGDENVEVMNDDALSVELPGEPFRVVANVPFNITTDILHKLLDDPASSPETTHLLVQSEVAVKHARRSPTTLKTLMWSPWYEFSASMRVPATSFHPIPDVDGRLLIAARRKQYLVAPHHKGRFREFARIMFTGRGRIVGERLRQVFTKTQARKLAKDIGFDRDDVPSSLTVHQWAEVFAFVADGNER